jgi:hypothetical protein
MKSVDEFAACLTNEHERDGHAWALLPTTTGGTFTNAGASAAPGDFWLRVREGRSGARLQLFAAGQAPPEITKALNQCR